jgi:Zn-finger nucleic acid-binding protein
MQCPKCKELLTNSQLFGSLKADACATCAGQWVDGDEYQQWRQVQNRATVDPMKVLRANLTAYKVPAETDTKTGLCPQCQRILSRTRVSTEPFFYLEQCLSCNGVWFDQDEAAILQQLKLHDQIEILSSGSWQSQVRSAQMLLNEKEAVIEKLGIDIAQQVFELAEILTEEPNGDFAVAYLMRRFERDSPFMQQSQV